MDTNFYWVDISEFFWGSRVAVMNRTSLRVFF